MKLTLYKVIHTAQHEVRREMPAQDIYREDLAQIHVAGYEFHMRPKLCLGD